MDKDTLFKKTALIAAIVNISCIAGMVVVTALTKGLGL